MTNVVMAVVTNVVVMVTPWGLDATRAGGKGGVGLASGGVMSEPIETRVVVTNVIKWSNETGCAMCSANPGIMPAVWHEGGFKPCAPYRAATERTETTEVVEIKTLEFKWDGQAVVVKREKVLSRVVKRWQKKETWEEAEGER